DRDADAIARFDELTTAAQDVPFESAATRFLDRFRDAWDARDWDRVAACFAPGYRTMDRRSMAHIEFDRETQLRSLRLAFELRSSRFMHHLLAIRGESLVVVRTRVEFEGPLDGFDAGPSELEHLEVLEVDHHGDAVAIVVLDLDDLDAAYAELDARYADSTYA